MTAPSDQESNENISVLILKKFLFLQNDVSPSLHFYTIDNIERWYLKKLLYIYDFKGFLLQ